MNIRLFINACLIMLTVLYPVGIYFGLQYTEPRYLILAMVALLALRFIFNTATSKLQKQHQLFFLIVMVLFFCFVFISNTAAGLLFYPVIVSALMLVLFGYTLLYPPSMIERLARLANADLPDSAIGYTRKVTMVWCLFFFTNGLIATFTALFCSMATWTLYNGFISYLIMGSIFCIEYLVRRQMKKQSH